MKSNTTFEYARIFNVKPLGNGCRFGIKVSSKKQDGSYTKGVFINCKHKNMLEQGDYTLKGFFGDNEYNGNNTLEFIVMEALLTGRIEQPSNQQQQSYQQPQANKHSGNEIPDIDIPEDEIPF